MAIYEVPEENLYLDMTVTGVITREEKLYYTPEAGYVNYYIHSGNIHYTQNSRLLKERI